MRVLANCCPASAQPRGRIILTSHFRPAPKIISPAHEKQEHQRTATQKLNQINAPQPWSEKPPWEKLATQKFTHRGGWIDWRGGWRRRGKGSRIWDRIG